MATTMQDVTGLATELGIAHLEILILQRENKELRAELEAAKARLELIGNPDGLHSMKVALKEAQDP